MSGANPCPCQANWLGDPQGHHRDPINNEKSWLDFSVRALSREVVRKGRGQETVWNESCSPEWWGEVGLPWKNPTSNPKDSKEALLQKYEALEKHLRLEKRFPMELEEEAWLWAQGKYKELFLLTSLTSLLGKVTSVHSAVLESSAKASDMKADINQSLVTKIESCLSSTLKSVENLKSSNFRPDLKRCANPFGKENGQAVKAKRLKTDSQVKELKVIKPKPIVSQTVSSCRSKLISPAQKGAAKKSECPKSLMKKSVSVRNQKEVLTASPPVCANESTVRRVPIQPTQPSLTSQPLTIQVSEEEFSQILQGKVFSLPVSAQSSQLHDSSENVASLSTPLVTSNPVELNAPSPQNNFHLQNNSNINRSQSRSSSCESSVSRISSPSVYLAESSTNASPLASPQCNRTAVHKEVVSLINESPSPVIPSADVVTVNTNNSYSDLLISSQSEIESRSPSFSCSRTNCGRTESSQSISSQQNSVKTDAGYGSDEGPLLDLDSIFSADEQSELWQEDGSFLLDRFLDELR